MFGYSPQVTDQSGQIMGAGMANAAQITSQGQIAAAEMAMKQAQLEAQQRQQLQQDIFGAIGDLANAYQQQETTKASVKSGEQMLKMFGPQLGIDSKILSSPEYKAMGLMGQSQLHSNIWGSLGSLSQLRMAQTRSQDASSRMYQQEALRRERDIVNNPPAPAPITVPTGMRRFSQPSQPGGI